MRFRNIFIGIGSLLVVLILLLTDPDIALVQNLPFGSSTLTVLILLATSVLFVGVLHFSRKALLDYLDLAELFRKAKTTPEGSGLAIIGVGLICVSIAILISAAAT